MKRAWPALLMFVACAHHESAKTEEAVPPSVEEPLSLEDRCDHNDMFGCWDFGLSLLPSGSVDGDTIVISAVRAAGVSALDRPIYVLEKACGGGVQNACRFIAHFYRELAESKLLENFGPHDPADTLTTLCHSGDANACAALGGIDDIGFEGRATNSSRALLFYGRACALGDERACYHLQPISFRLYFSEPSPSDALLRTVLAPERTCNLTELQKIDSAEHERFTTPTILRVAPTAEQPLVKALALAMASDSDMMKLLKVRGLSPDDYAKAKIGCWLAILHDAPTDTKVLRELGYKAAVAEIRPHDRFRIVRDREPEPTVHENPGLISREAILGDPGHFDPYASPDGHSIAWLAPVDATLNIWVAPFDDTAAARPLTHDDRSVTNLIWAYDNAHLLYTRDGTGDEHTHLMVVDLGSGVTKDATPKPGSKTRVVAVSPLFPKRVLIALNARDDEVEDIYELDVASLGLRLVYENREKLQEIIASDDFKTLVGLKPSPGRSGDVTVVDLSSKKQPLHVISRGNVARLERLSPDGKRLYVRVPSAIAFGKGADTSMLGVVAVANGEGTFVAADSRSDVLEVVYHPRTRTPAVVTFEYDTTSMVVLDASVAADVALLHTVDDGNFTWTASLDNRRWIVQYASRNAPARYYTFDRDSGTAHLLFHRRGDGAAQAIYSDRRSVLIDARDGEHLVSYLTRPIAAKGPLPLVLFVHGGPSTRDYEDFDSEAAWLANRGYAVLQVNYRGSLGFGSRFYELGALQWGASMQNDLEDAVKWAILAGVTTADRVAIWGGSYGGFAALTGLTRTPEMFQCAVELAGPADLESFINALPGYAKPWFFVNVGDPTTDDGKKLLRERSPLTHIAAVTKPLLMFQGTNDIRVKLEQSERVFAALQGRDVRYGVVDNEGHGVWKPRNRLATYAFIEEFLAKCLGGRAEPVGDALSGTTLHMR